MDAPHAVADGEAPINSVGDPSNNWIPAFEPGAGMSGSDLIIDTETGGAWFSLFQAANTYAGEDNLVLIGQFTTDTTLYGVVSFAVSINGDVNNIINFTIPIPGLAAGCTDPAATNYCGCATQDDGSCEFGLGCIHVEACNYNPAATEDDGSCLYLDAAGDCGGSCAEDADADGVCDDVDDCIGTV